MADPNDEDGSPDEDAIAAEWEAMMAAEGSGEGGGDQGDVDALFAEEGTRALSQDEIDSLLGFDQGDEGDEFDPGLHEAVQHEGDGTHPVVGTVMRKGYKVGEQVVRHAMVGVVDTVPEANGSGDTGADAGSEAGEPSES